MGAVYRASDPRLGRDVAIKILHAGTGKDADALQPFEREARAAGALNHPNILSIYDIGIHDGTPFIVTELLQGETLRSLLDRGPIPPARAVGYAAQIAAGLGAAHAKGIVHRDLKPANLFIAEAGQIKILDFGLAKLASTTETAHLWSDVATRPGLTGHGSIKGTVSYMSPEQILGHPIDQRSDLFSFGVVLLEMLTGRRPFDRGPVFETMHAILKEELPDSPSGAYGVPPELEPVIRHCLEKDPNERYQSARDLGFQLTSVAGSSPSRATVAPGPRPPSVVPWWSRAAILVLLAVMVLVAGFVVGKRAGRTEPPGYRQLTFRRGEVHSARFAPDGQAIVYGAAWEGKPFELFSTRLENAESRPVGVAGDILSISSSGQMAISLGRHYVVGLATRGTLAELPLVGGVPREILTDVEDADWAPDGRSLAVVHAVQGRYRLEFPIGNVLYQTDGWITHPRVSRDGGLVAFIDHPVYGDDRGTIAVVDSSRQKRTLTRGWASANGLSWSPRGDELWFTASEVGPNCALYAVTLSGSERLMTRSAGRLLLQDVYRDGRMLITQGRAETVMSYRGAGGSAERDLSWFDASVAADLSPDGQTVLFNEQGTGGASVTYAVYSRKTDGSPAVRLGEGTLAALSPDGSWVASIVLGSRPSLRLLPTGPGQSITLNQGQVTSYEAVDWFPSGRRVVFTGTRPGQGPRIYAQEVPNGLPAAIAPEGFRTLRYTHPISPDGGYVASVDRNERIELCRVAGGEPVPVEGLDPGYIPIRWTADGRGLYVYRHNELPGRVCRVTLTEKRKDPVIELFPSDPAGFRDITTVQTTPDGRAFVFSYARMLSDLYQLQGVR